MKNSNYFTNRKLTQGIGFLYLVGLLANSACSQEAAFAEWFGKADRINQQTHQDLPNQSDVPYENFPGARALSYLPNAHNANKHKILLVARAPTKEVVDWYQRRLPAYHRKDYVKGGRAYTILIMTLSTFDNPWDFHDLINDRYVLITKVHEALEPAKDNYETVIELHY